MPATENVPQGLDLPYLSTKNAGVFDKNPKKFSILTRKRALELYYRDKMR